MFAHRLTGSAVEPGRSMCMFHGRSKLGSRCSRLRWLLYLGIDCSTGGNRLCEWNIFGGRGKWDCFSCWWQKGRNIFSVCRRTETCVLVLQWGGQLSEGISFSWHISPNNEGAAEVRGARTIRVNNRLAQERTEDGKQCREAFDSTLASVFCCCKT